MICRFQRSLKQLKVWLVYDRHGRLFSGNLKRKEVNNETYLLQVLAYIHLNPVNHGFCSRPEDYTYSSFWSYLLPEKASKVNRSDIYDLFSSTKEFIEFHKQLIVEKNLIDVIEFY